MNAKPPSKDLPPENPHASQAPSRLPRLNFPLWLVGIYWVLYFVVTNLEKPYFYGFIYGIASSLIFIFCFLGWWWFNRTLRLSEKAAGFLLIVAGAWIAIKYCDRTMNILAFGMVGVPLTVTLIVGWMVLVRRKLLPENRLAFVAASLPAWALLLCLRTDGLDAGLKAQISWRWTPTAEERFLALHSTSAAVAAGTAASEAPALQTTPDSWPAFRGAERDGVTHGSKVAADWKTTPPPQLWRHAVGPAWSSLIVVGDRLFTQEQRGPKETVVCYDSATGNELWAHADEVRFDEGVSGPGPRATPTFAQGCIYSLGGTGILNCLDASTGKLRWSRDINLDSHGQPPMWGLSSSPLVTGQNVIVYGGGKAGKSLLAYRADSGELAWAAPAGENSYSSPQLVTIAGVPQCLMYHDYGLTSVDPATGKELWKTGLAMPGAPRCSQPHLIGASRLAVATLNGPGTSLIEVTRDGDQWKVSPCWVSKDLKPEFPDFVVHNGDAYGFDGSMFCCLDLASGKRAWKDGHFGRGQVILLEDQGLLVVTSETGEVILQAADAQSRKELGRFQALNGKTWNHAVVANSHLFLRNAEEMACYSLQPSPQVSMR